MQASNVVAAGSSQQKLSTFVCTGDQQAAFARRIAAFFIKSFTPFERIEHPDFLAAQAHLGCKPPTRKQLSDVYLPMLYEEEMARVKEEIGLHKVKSLSL
jgi:hypothetical protein